MQPAVPTTTVTAARAAVVAALGDVVLRAGATVAARVVSAPAAGGPGLLALAGALVRARLPAGLQEGQRLQLDVAGFDGERIVLRLAQGHGTEAAPRAELAAALARSGDGDLVRVALALADAPIPLPGAGLAEVAVDPDGAAAGAGEGAPAEARVVLHAHRLGPIEVRLRLDAAGVRARVLVEPGEARALAAGAAPELDAALARAVGRPAVVEVAARPPEERPSLPAGAAPWVDAYA